MPLTIKPEIRDLWVAALESGEYKQTTCRLRDSTGFCCLGVLCDLHEKATGNEGWMVDNDFCYEYLFTTAVLPPVVRQWAGMVDADPALEVATYSKPKQASLLNDCEGKSFKEIAAVIRAQEVEAAPQQQQVEE